MNIFKMSVTIKDTLKVLLSQAIIQYLQWSKRTSDGGNGNHSVSLPIILIKIKFDQMILSSYISSLLVISL